MSRTRLHLFELDDRALPSVGVDGLIAVGADAGGLPEVKLLDADGSSRGSFLAYDESFRGGVRVSVGDVTGDGKPDIVTAPGVGGGPEVKIFDGDTGREIASFFAYDPAFRGGVSLDVGVLNGREVIVTGSGLSGAPVVKVFDGPSRRELLRFTAYDPGFLGGVNVAVGNVLGDARGQIVTAPGPGGGPHVKVFDGGTGTERASFFAYAPGFTGGVSVATGNVVNLGGRDAVVTGAGPGGGPQVNIFDAVSGKSVQTQFAYSADFRGGVNVGVVQGGPGQSDRLITAAGPSGGPQVNVYNNWNTNNYYGGGSGYGYGGLGYGAFGLGNSFFAFPSYFTGGLGFGTGYGLFGNYVPLFRPYFGSGGFYNTFAPPVYVVDNVYVDPAVYDYGGSYPGDFGPVYDTNPANFVPDTIPYIEDDAAGSYYSDAGYYDPGYYDSGYYDDYGYYDSGFGGYDDFGGGYGGGF